jgi:hypothetical protein
MEIVLVLDPVGSFGEKIPIMILFNRLGNAAYALAINCRFSSRPQSCRM